MAQLIAIPPGMVKLIPVFEGDKRQLNLFIRKVEYIVDKYHGDENQNEYVFQTITSRLSGDAAALLSEREDIVTWPTLKTLFIQHFGDPRSEECVAIELESLKIKTGESYTQFCNRIQSIRSVLFAKVNQLQDQNIKTSKIAIYNNMSQNVFLHNLSENMVRIVRLKGPTSLEQALTIVLEEVNFYDQYNARNKLHNRPNFSPTQSFGFKPSLPNINNAPHQNRPWQFGVQPQNPGFRPNAQAEPRSFGYKPPLPGFRPQQFGQQTGPQQPQQIGYRPPQQFGYKPPQQIGYRPPQQFGYKPPQQLGYRPPQQFGYRPPQNTYKSPQLDNDVSMRTVKPKSSFPLNELEVDGEIEQSYECYDDSYEYAPGNDECNYVESHLEHCDDVGDNNDSKTDLETSDANVNFHLVASYYSPKK